MLLTNSSEIDPSRDYDGIALYSGGTDSTLAPLLARQTIGDRILLVMVDLGETQASREQAVERAKIIGWDFLLADERASFADEILREAIQMRASYWGYPLGTPLGRAFQLMYASKVMETLNSYCRRPRFIIHGCGPRQNTRFRIERYLDHVPDVRPLGPLCERMLTRQEKVDMLAEHGINAVAGDGVATDQNIYCRAMEGDLLNTLNDPSELEVYTHVLPVEKATGIRHLTVSFDGGVPTEVDGAHMPLFEIVRECSRQGSQMGVGRICVFEDTIPELGYKERGIYEAPAAVLLAAAHRYLEGATLSKLNREIFRDLRHRWAEVVYRGDWHTSERGALGGEGARFNSAISGSVTLKLWPGALSVGSASCDALLISSEAARGAY